MKMHLVIGVVVFAAAASPALTVITGETHVDRDTAPFAPSAHRQLPARVASGVTGTSALTLAGPSGGWTVVYS